MCGSFQGGGQHGNQGGRETGYVGFRICAPAWLTSSASYEEDGDGKSAMSQLNNQDLNAELNK